MGIQYTPVECMATVFTPQRCNQSARRCRSAVQHSNRRTGCESRSGRISDVMQAVPNIDPRCMRMDYIQTRVLRLQLPSPFFSLLPVPPQFSVGHDSRSSVKGWDPVRPGDDRLRNLSNGVKGPATSMVLATMPAIASTGAMLLCAREAPVGS